MNESVKGEPITLHIATRFDMARAIEGVPEGQRDVTLFRLAESLHRASVPMEYAISMVPQAVQQEESQCSCASVAQRPSNFVRPL